MPKLLLCHFNRIPSIRYKGRDGMPEGMESTPFDP